MKKFGKRARGRQATTIGYRDVGHSVRPRCAPMPQQLDQRGSALRQ
jgi:hypothetical protein